jgi:hypothetical protein
MRGWLQRGMLVALVFGACWGGAVWYWRATNRMPAGGDLALYLLALPLALLFSLWLGRRLVVAAAAPAAVAAPDNAPAPVPAVVRPAPLAIVDAAVRVPRGASPTELAEAFAEHQARAALDPELVDADGFPAMTARSADAVAPGVQEEISAWLAANGMADVAFSAAQWRALTLASAVASDLGSAAAVALLPADGAPPPLRLIALMPTDWPSAQRGAARAWLRHTVAQFGWPDSLVVLDAELPTEAHEAGVTGQLRRLGAAAAQATNAASATPLVAILLACGSQLEQATVDAWHDAGSLFTASRPQGMIPGEGAAGLLLADLAQARAHPELAFTLLHGASEGRHERSSDGAARADSALLAALAAEALATAAADAADVALIVADTGHRANRVLELVGAAGIAAPGLDAAADVLRIGAAGGHCGAVPLTTALALAHDQALARGAPVLCISNEDPHHRCAALIGPAAFAS